MATATAKKPTDQSAEPDAPVDDTLIIPDPAPAPLPGCGDPKCTGTSAYAPVALTVTANVATGRTRTLTAAAGSGACLPRNLVWDFGDGSAPVVGSSPQTHQFPATGTPFTVTVTPQTSTKVKAGTVAVAIT
jgi:hypothetical protein